MQSVSQWKASKVNTAPVSSTPTTGLQNVGQWKKSQQQSPQGIDFSQATIKPPKFSLGTFIKDTAKEAAKLPLRMGASVADIGLSGAALLGSEKAKTALENTKKQGGYEAPFGIGKVRAISDTGETVDIKGTQFPVTSLKDIAGAGAEAASYLPIARLPALGAQALKQTIIQGAKAFGKEGAIAGGVGGAGHELQNPESTFGSVAEAGAIGSLGGAVLGGALGGSVPILGRGVSKLTGKKPLSVAEWKDAGKPTAPIEAPLAPESARTAPITPKVENIPSNAEEIQIARFNFDATYKQGKWTVPVDRQVEWQSALKQIRKDNLTYQEFSNAQPKIINPLQPLSDALDKVSSRLEGDNFTRQGISSLQANMDSMDLPTFVNKLEKIIGNMEGNRFASEGLNEILVKAKAGIQKELTRGTQLKQITSPLAQEAQTLEEFVKAQGTPTFSGGSEITKEWSNEKIGGFGTIFRGRNELGGGIYITNSPEYAKTFGSQLTESSLKNNLKLLDVREESKEIGISAVNKIKKGFDSYDRYLKNGGEELLPTDYPNEILDKIQAVYGGNSTNILKKAGFDGIVGDESRIGGQGGTVWNIFDAKNIKTKSQLTDIWNKATKGVEALTKTSQRPAADLISGGKLSAETGTASIQSSPVKVSSLRNAADDLSNISAKPLPDLIESLKISPDSATNLVPADVASIRELYTNIDKKASAFLEIMQKGIDAGARVPSKTDGPYRSIIDIKRLSSILDKIGRKRIKKPYSASDMGDLIRGDLMVDSPSQALKVLDSMKEYVEPGSVGNHFEAPNEWGYRGMNYNIKLPDGTITEVQVHTPLSSAIKDAIHPLYSKYRSSTEIPESAFIESRKLAEQAEAKFLKGGTPKADPQFQSRVFERLKAENPSLEGDLNYNPIKLKEDAEKAVNLITKDKQKAFDIAMGKESSSDVTSTAVNIAMAEKALNEGNIPLYTRLIKNRSLEQTRRGQEIVAEKGSVTDNSTSRYVKELIALRLEKLGNKYLADVKDIGKKTSAKQKGTNRIEKEVQKMQTQIKEKKLTMADARELLDALACV